MLFPTTSKLISLKTGQEFMRVFMPLGDWSCFQPWATQINYKIHKARTRLWHSPQSIGMCRSSSLSPLAWIFTWTLEKCLFTLLIGKALPVCWRFPEILLRSSYFFLYLYVVLKMNLIYRSHLITMRFMRKKIKRKCSMHSSGCLSMNQG